MSTRPEGADRDWWDRVGEMRWQHIVVLLAAMAMFVALCFAPAASCSIKSEPTSTESRR